jgi:hypothetical protein
VTSLRGISPGGAFGGGIVRVINYSQFDTRALRRFFHAGLKAMGAETNKIIYVYNEGRRQYSRARLGKWGQERLIWMVIHPDRNWTQFALVFEHEVAHNLGVRHREMDRETYGSSGVTPDWAKPHIPIPVKQAKPKRDIVVVREAHARKMLERAGKRLKIAKTVYRRWARKVKYYERRGRTAASQNVKGIS